MDAVASRRTMRIMIKSRPQAGHRRKMTSAQLSAQSASRNLCGETENGINRVVLRWSSAPALTSQDLSRERSSFLLKKNPTGREYGFLYAFLGM